MVAASEMLTRQGSHSRRCQILRLRNERQATASNPTGTWTKNGTRAPIHPVTSTPPGCQLSQTALQPPI